MVVFANFESFSNINTWQFESVAPAGGLGLRIKLNKYSRTNIAIDYGWGRQGSRGFFVTLGEAFWKLFQNIINLFQLRIH